VILKDLLSERVALIPIYSSFKPIFDAFILKYTVAIEMYPGLTLAAIYHVTYKVLLKFGSRLSDLLRDCYNPFISLLNDVIGP
jgi:hypothetical protein